jgi:hypothetical protein
LGGADLLAATLRDAGWRARARLTDTSRQTYRRLAGRGDARLATLRAQPAVIDALDRASEAGEQLYQGIQHGVDELHDASEEALGQLYRHSWWRAPDRSCAMVGTRPHHADHHAAHRHSQQGR